MSERLSWSGGDAVVELDASDRSVVGSTERMRIKVGFWPRLPVLYKDGAQILLIVPEQ